MITSSSVPGYVELSKMKVCPFEGVVVYNAEAEMRALKSGSLCSLIGVGTVTIT